MVQKLLSKKPQERFFAKVDASGICWEWTASINPDGYGKFWRGGSTTNSSLSHRWAYEYLVGPIPNGLTIDHVCRNRRCVNPDHLEPVTHAENSSRAHPRLEVCSQGHDMSVAYIRTNGGRMCRQCRNARERAAYRRQGAKTDG